MFKKLLTPKKKQEETLEEIIQLTQIPKSKLESARMIVSNSIIQSRYEKCVETKDIKTAKKIYNLFDILPSSEILDKTIEYNSAIKFELKFDYVLDKLTGKPSVKMYNVSKIDIILQKFVSIYPTLNKEFEKFAKDIDKLFGQFSEMNDLISQKYDDSYSKLAKGKYNSELNKSNNKFSYDDSDVFNSRMYVLVSSSKKLYKIVFEKFKDNIVLNKTYFNDVEIMQGINIIGQKTGRNYISSIESLKYF